MKSYVEKPWFFVVFFGLGFVSFVLFVFRILTISIPFAFMKGNEGILPQILRAREPNI